jgi:predicted dehydrogenase
MLKFGVIGYGYWGPNIVRNLSTIDGCSVSVVCDPSPAARTRAQKAHPGLRVVSDAAEIMSDPEIDAVAVITPVWTHYEL